MATNEGIICRKCTGTFSSGKLEGDEYRYDFTDALEYELEEYIMTYGDLADATND